jgi:hypothetical protein
MWCVLWPLLLYQLPITVMSVWMMNLKGFGRKKSSSNLGTIRAFAWRGWREPRKTSIPPCKYRDRLLWMRFFLGFLSSSKQMPGWTSSVRCLLFLTCFPYIYIYIFSSVNTTQIKLITWYQLLVYFLRHVSAPGAMFRYYIHSVLLVIVFYVIPRDGPRGRNMS